MQALCCSARPRPLFIHCWRSPPPLSQRQSSLAALQYVLQRRRPPRGAQRHAAICTDSNDGSSTNGSSNPGSPPKPSTSGSSEELKPPSAPASDPETRPSRRRPKSSPPSWLSQLASRLNLQQPIRFLFNVAALLLIMQLWPIPGSRTPLTKADSLVVNVGFSDFVRQVRKNEVSRVVVDGPVVTYQLRPIAEWLRSLPEGYDKGRFTLSTVRPSDYPAPYDQLLNNGVQFSALDKRGDGLMGNLLTYGVVILLVVAVLNRLPLKLTQRGPARRNSSAQSPASVITFADVAGVDEAKEELQEVVDYLRDPEKFAKLGARPPGGILLVGPPGTGKTLLARAVAGEADVPFFSISASEFVELYVGMGALRVRELFANARRESPAIVFIDEIDAVAKGRDSRLRSVGNDEREQTLNQLLTELDGFDSHKEQMVICIAATNRPDVLDAALLRPGRFDRRVAVERPDRQGREEILRVHIDRKALPLAADVRISILASQTTGFTGADLANLVNEAALLAGRTGKVEVGAVDFDAAVLRAVAGVEKKRSMLHGMEKTVVARHEVGHALAATAVAALLPGSNPVERLSIIPRSGGALGFTYSPQVEDRALLFDTEIRGQLVVLMGGRAAEAVSCESISTGAVDDIRRATDLANKAVAEYGLSAAVGPLNVGAMGGGGEDYAVLRDSGAGMGRTVDAEVRALCEAALAAAKDVISLNRALHSRLAVQLEQEERLEGAGLREALEGALVPYSLREFVLQGKAVVKGSGALPAPASPPALLTEQA